MAVGETKTGKDMKILKWLVIETGWWEPRFIHAELAKKAEDVNASDGTKKHFLHNLGWMFDGLRCASGNWGIRVNKKVRFAFWRPRRLCNICR